MGDIAIKHKPARQSSQVAPAPVKVAEQGQAPRAEQAAAPTLGWSFADIAVDRLHGDVARIQRSPAIPRPHVAREDEVARGSSASGGGPSVPAPILRAVEQRVGGIGPVRVHDDPGAHAMARGLDAAAFTVGRDIFFSAGSYQPHTLAGTHLIAHELAHVKQQTAAGQVQLQRQSQSYFDRQRRALDQEIATLTASGTSAATADEREDARVRAALMEAARGFGQMHGQASVFCQSLYRFARGTPSSRMQWQAILRQLYQAGFVERVCIDMNARGGLSCQPVAATCHPRWEVPMNIGGRVIWVVPAWRSKVRDNAEVQVLTNLGGRFLDAFWIGISEGQQQMTRWDIWDVIDMLEPAFAALGAGAGRAAVSRALGVGRRVTGLFSALLRTRPMTRLVAILRRVGPSAQWIRTARSALASGARSATAWIGAQLRVGAEVAQNLSMAAIRRLHSLGRAALERIAQLSQAAKRVLLGCTSPCRVDLTVIRNFLAQANRPVGQVLSTANDIIAAVPNVGQFRQFVRNRLNRHPAMVTFIREANLTDADFQVLHGFLTAADGTSARSARQTFSRFLTQIVAAKAPNITALNRIIAAAEATGGRIVNALKGSMFESFVRLHVAELRGHPVTRLTFVRRAGLVLSRGRRTFDNFVASLRRVYEIKHTGGAVPASQLRDYRRILTHERAGLNRFDEIVYIFPSRQAAQSNRHILRYYADGFRVKYISAAGRLLELTP